MNHICSGSHLTTLNFAAHLRPRLMFCNTMLQPKLGCGSSAKSSGSHFHSLQNNLYINIQNHQRLQDSKIIVDCLCCTCTCAAYNMNQIDYKVSDEDVFTTCTFLPSVRTCMLQPQWTQYVMYNIHVRTKNLQKKNRHTNISLGAPSC